MSNKTEDTEVENQEVQADAPERDIEAELRVQEAQNQILQDQLRRWIDRYFGLKLASGEIPSAAVGVLVNQEIQQIVGALQQAAQQAHEGKERA